MGTKRVVMQLHKLSGIKSEKELEDIISTLWRTRKTGLSTPEKSYVLSLLNLPNIAQLDPVLVCLRSLIRKCVHENFPVNDILKVFPPDLPIDRQSALIMIFQKCQNQWKEEISRDQHQLSSTNFPLQTNPGLPLPLTSFSSSEIAASLWPRQAGPAARNRNNFGASTPSMTDINVLHLTSMPLQRDVGTNNLGTLPRLKSMTWTLNNRSKTPTNRVAVISLKLQDYTKSPLGETEVKFQLTRETLEAMLKSMTYINEQLSSYVGTSSKKQRQ